jgi:tyrosine-protein kinase Etk/Wzc
VSLLNRCEVESLEQDRIDVYRLYFLLAKWRKFILKTVLVVCGVTTVVLLILPSWYKATTSVLPPEREASLSGLASSLLQGVGIMGGQEMILPAFATPSHVYASILKSRTVVEAIVARYGLKEHYRCKTMDDAVKKCLSHTKIRVGSEGIVTVSFEDTNRDRAADVANSFVEMLNTINREVNSARARNNRLFLEERLGETSSALRTAEDTLTSFQETNKAVSLEEQMKAQIQNVAELEGKLAMAEIELGLFQRTLTPGHPEIVRKQMEISEIRRRINAMNVGLPGSEDYGTLALPFSQVPRLTLEFGRLLRNLKLEETLFRLLTEQYEHAKIQEVKDTPTIQILDVARPPEKKSRPKRLIILAITGGLSIVLSVLYASAAEHIERLRVTRPRDWETLRDSTSEMRTELTDFWKKATRFFRGRH